MAPLEEIPVDLVRQVQILLRKDANLSSYDPHDPSLPNLPSTDQVIAEFDPSPPHLRCANCRGRLPRGLQSIICVYCGLEQKGEVAPEPILFKNTAGFRWLLETLDLDGSVSVSFSCLVAEKYRGNEKKMWVFDIMFLGRFVYKQLRKVQKFKIPNSKFVFFPLYFLSNQMEY